MKFNSQICTTRDQSERLLSLGLKKETADCSYLNFGRNSQAAKMYYDVPSIGEPYGDDIPAWSLHRMIEIVDNPYAIKHWIGCCIPQDYDHLIDIIKICIELGEIDKEYLEDK